MIKEFRVFYGGEPATMTQLDAIEEIVVEQEIGVAWHATIKIPICVAEDGTWGGENDPAYAEFARVRIEARIAEKGDFVPLIDGRITRQDPGLSAAPGSSTLTLTVQDDTTILHREAASADFPGASASEIAEEIFTDAALGGTVEVETTGPPPNPNAVIQRSGTAMQILRSLMRRYPDHYAYVLPGTAPSTSDCFFKPLPTEPDPDLPTLIITGKDRNISSFNVSRDSNSAANFQGDSMSLDDLSPRSGTSASSETAPPAGETATAANPENTRVHRLPPGSGDLADLSDTATGAANRASYTLRAEGSVLPQVFPKILSPYRMIRTGVSDSQYSANYVIFKVTHTLGRSEYMQSFSVRGNSITPAADAPGPAAAALAAVGAAAVSFNIQVDIF